MEQKENQKEINQTEWNNPDNWSVGFYPGFPPTHNEAGGWTSIAS